MTRVAALLLAHWRIIRTYRVQTMLSMAGLVVGIIPLYFVARAVQPIMAGSIAAEGGNAFAFLVVGLAAFTLVTTAITVPAQVLSDRINSGVMEALLSTPTPTTSLFVGLSAFDFLLAFIRALVMCAAAAALGASFAPGAILPALAILFLTVCAHLPFGLLGASMVLAFRSPGPIPKTVMMLSGLLGGVYYPTAVIPSWLRAVSDALPLSHGLRALRRVLLQNESLASVAPELLALIVTTVVLFGVATVALSTSLRYARVHGTLAQY